MDDRRQLLADQGHHPVTVARQRALCAILRHPSSAVWQPEKQLERRVAERAPECLLNTFTRPPEFDD